MATQSIPKITEEEYLRLEEGAQEKSEFICGEILAMARGTFRHSRLAVNWTIDLGSKLRGRNCGIFSSDARIRTPLTGSFLYPDVSVVCGEPQPYLNRVDTFTNPKVVIEILSPSTAGYDHGKKFELYREIHSLQDYVLVHAGSPYVEHFARQEDSSWVLREYRGLEAAIHIVSIDCAVRLQDIYTGVFELPA